jgi:hypothetical protein
MASRSLSPSLRPPTAVPRRPRLSPQRLRLIALSLRVHERQRDGIDLGALLLAVRRRAMNDGGAVR